MNLKSMSRTHSKFCLQTIQKQSKIAPSPLSQKNKRNVIYLSGNKMAGSSQNISQKSNTQIKKNL
jgi:hypothetical protein